MRLVRMMVSLTPEQVARVRAAGGGVFTVGMRAAVDGLPYLEEAGMSDGQEDTDVCTWDG